MNASDGGGKVSSSEGVDENLRREYEQLREETISLRKDAEQRLMVASEMEERASEEHASLRRTINLLNQQLQLEKQLVADSNAQIIELQRRLSAVEEAAKRESAASASQLQSTEAELARLRQCLSSKSSPDIARSPTSPPSPSEQPQLRTDVEARVLELEARVRQLNDSLLTKQDSLEATLAQNHALKVGFHFLPLSFPCGFRGAPLSTVSGNSRVKLLLSILELLLAGVNLVQIRLERLESECDAHLLEPRNTRSSAFSCGHAHLPQNSSSQSPHGFARLHFIVSLKTSHSAVLNAFVRM
ncbi:unnamed protein product [Hydatigera taeniaeformis]|uniref:Uncharacterized protein n=1 Tax=Hydatigena taeniaeformis TaxID=6205 RepID=A0A3P7GXH0_HYDTA|nr:unnamed protein product [Hydatigera taeniaeformis]